MKGRVRRPVRAVLVGEGHSDASFSLRRRKGKALCVDSVGAMHFGAALGYAVIRDFCFVARASGWGVACCWRGRGLEGHKHSTTSDNVRFAPHGSNPPKSPGGEKGEMVAAPKF